MGSGVATIRVHDRCELASKCQRGIAAEEISREGRGGDPIATEIDDIRVGAVGDDREMDVALRPIVSDRRVHLRPRGKGHIWIPRPPHADEDVGGAEDPHIQRRGDTVVMHAHFDLVGGGANAGDGAGDVGPSGARIVAPEDARVFRRGIKARGDLGIGHEIAHRPRRQTGADPAGNQGECPARVGAAKQTAAGTRRFVVGGCHDDCASRRHARDVLIGKRGSSEGGPARAAVRGAQHADEEAAAGCKAAHPRDACDECLRGCVGCIKFHRANIQRTLVVRQRRPRRARVRGIRRLPDTAADGADVEDIGVGWMGGDGLDRAANLVVWRDVDLPAPRRCRSHENPRRTHGGRRRGFDTAFGFWSLTLDAVEFIRIRRRELLVIRLRNRHLIGANGAWQRARGPSHENQHE